MCFGVSPHLSTAWPSPLLWLQLPKSFKKEGKDALWLTADYRPGDLVVFNVKSVRAGRGCPSFIFAVGLVVRGLMCTTCD